MDIETIDDFEVQTGKGTLPEGCEFTDYTELDVDLYTKNTGGNWPSCRTRSECLTSCLASGNSCTQSKCTQYDMTGGDNSCYFGHDDCVQEVDDCEENMEEHDGSNWHKVDTDDIKLSDCTLESDGSGYSCEVDVGKALEKDDIDCKVMIKVRTTAGAGTDTDTNT